MLISDEAGIKADRVEKYECIITACQNPVCTCGVVYLHLIPLLTKNGNERHLSPQKLEIDIGKKSLGYRNKKKAQKKDLEFAGFFLSEFDENDFKILYERHFAFKNKITEEADLVSIDVYFEFDKVECRKVCY